MKRLLLVSLAALALAGPLAVTGASAHPNDRYDGGYDNRDDQAYRQGEYGGRDYDNRDDRRDERQAYRHGQRDGQEHARFDRSQHNGYYIGRQWYYGPPPQAYYNRSDVRYDYRDWRRGDRLPRYYQEQYRPVDYHDHRLYAPPRGARWVEDDRGEYLLVGVATGVILGLALGH